MSKSAERCGALLALLLSPLTLHGNAWAQNQETTTLGVPKAQLAPISKEWKPVIKNTPPGRVVQLLSEEGWAGDDVAKSLSGASTFDVYKQIIAPGVDTYLAVPTSGVAHAIQFGTGITGGQSTEIVKAGFLEPPSSEEIRERILSGIQAAIDALCSMPARPAEITAKASAFGVVEISARWDSGEVCGKQP